MTQQDTQPQFEGSITGFYILTAIVILIVIPLMFGYYALVKSSAPAVFNSPPGFLGTDALRTQDLTLLAYIFLLIPSMFIGYGYARRLKFIRHKYVMTAITLFNWAIILYLMAVSYSYVVVPTVSKNLSQFAASIPTFHLLTGLSAQILATVSLIRMWFERRLPKSLRYEPIKPQMILTLILWLITAALGILIYLNWYGIPFQSKPADTGGRPAVVGTEEATKPPQAATEESTKTGPVGTDEATKPVPAGTQEATTLAPISTNQATKLPLAATQEATATPAALPLSTITISLEDDAFNPKTITITAGTTLNFVNKGTHPHTVTADDGSFDSGQLKAAQSFNYTFNKPADVPIHCENHGEKGGKGMSMVVHVLGNAGPIKTEQATTSAPAKTEEATKPAPTSAPVAVPTSPATLSSDTLTALKQLISGANDTPNKVAYLTGVKSQTAIIDAQAQAMADALKLGHIEDAQAAAEGIMNTINGGVGQDLDKDGKINQPGDGYGLQQYSSKVSEALHALFDVPTNMRSAVTDMQNASKNLLKDSQDISTQAQALIATSILVDARNIGPKLSAAVTSLDADVKTLTQAAPTLPIQ